MSQADFEIANQGFPSFRSDLNSNLQALASNSAGATEPSTTFAYQFWYDETTDLLKLRNSDDDAWITLAYFDQTNDEWEIRSAVIQAVDSAGVVIKTDDGTTRLTIADDGSITTQGDLTVGGDLDASSGTIKLDGDYPVGTYNVALGDAALDSGSLTGGFNVAVGTFALTNNTSGSTNTAVGQASVEANITGGSNTGIGQNSLKSNTTGSSNTGIGKDALRLNTTASNNTAVGYRAGYSNDTGSYNVFLGYEAGKDGSTSARNTFIGYRAGENITTGICNVFVGGTDTSQNGSGSLITTGSKNSILGSFDGNQGGLDIRTSSNYIVLSDGDGNPRAWHDGSSWNGIGGLTEADQWILTTNLTAPSGTISTNLARLTTGAANYLGTGMTESSGIFTFPSTGFWLVQFSAIVTNNASGSDDRVGIVIEATQNNSSYSYIAEAGGGVDGTVGGGQEGFSAQAIIDVTDTANVKVRFTAGSFAATTLLQGASGYLRTGFSFIRLGDT